MAKKPIQKTTAISESVPSTTTQEATGLARVYRGQTQFDTDLYKLELNFFRRNRAFMPNEKPDWERIEHVHHFHTIDSNGKKQTRSTSIGGHFHVMELVSKSKDGASEYKCSPAMKMVKRKNAAGAVVLEAELLDYDNHTHEVTYERSTKIELRKQNPNAVNVIAADANKTAPIAGVVG